MWIKCILRGLIVRPLNSGVRRYEGCMTIDPASPGKSFEELWSELPTAAAPGRQIATFYGNPVTIKAITESRVTIEPSDMSQSVGLPRQAFESVYSEWRKWRYESLSHHMSQELLLVISIIDHVVQTWVRREDEARTIEQARACALPDGVFWILNYNKHSRFIGPRPHGNPISLSDVFPDQSHSTLDKLEAAASRVYESEGWVSALINSSKEVDARDLLAAKHPGFGKGVYDSVVLRACYSVFK
jgi:hypothetical protein